MAWQTLRAFLQLIICDHIILVIRRELKYRLSLYRNVHADFGCQPPASWRRGVVTFPTERVPLAVFQDRLHLGTCIAQRVPTARSTNVAMQQVSSYISEIVPTTQRTLHIAD